MEPLYSQSPLKRDVYAPSQAPRQLGSILIREMEVLDCVCMENSDLVTGTAIQQLYVFES